MNFDKQLLASFFLWIVCENVTCIIHRIDTELNVNANSVLPLRSQISEYD